MRRPVHTACSCDVLVVGSGLAGIVAAVSAAEAGARTVLASAGPIFSGASFGRGTWGFGMVGPQSPEDEADLVDTILDIGCGAADPALVRSFVHRIPAAISWLEREGMELKKPERPDEREYIPCFDHACRLWRGIVGSSFVEAFSKRIGELGIVCLPGYDLVSLIQREGGPVEGGVFYVPEKDGFEAISASATILATGGLGGLFGRTLGSAQDTGCGHALASRAGACLANLEFIQLMPAILADGGLVVFNEKTFRYLETEEGTPLSPDMLHLRSSHGPATARVGDADVDRAIAAAGPAGLPVRFGHLPDPLPELDRTYFDWLRETHGIDPTEPFRLVLCAHASNGGIAVDEEGFTGIEGLYAAGEATGGMHGADRLGGLSSANCVVFGIASGAAAARRAQERTAAPEAEAVLSWQASPVAGKALPSIRLAFDAACLADRRESELVKAASSLGLLAQAVERTAVPSDSAKDVAATMRSELELESARIMLSAIRQRRKSAGSHIRSDG